MIAWAATPTPLNNGEGAFLAARDVSDQVARRQNSLDERHRNAALREARGEVVATRAKDGKPYDHINEIRETANGLGNDIKRIDKQLARSDLAKGNREIYEAARSKASNLLDIANRTLRKVDEIRN